jgi:hypothetical protein
MRSVSKNHATTARSNKHNKVAANKLKKSSKKMAKESTFHDIYMALLAENAEPIVETTINDIADKMSFVCEHLKDPYTRDKAMTILRHLGRKVVELTESKKKKIVVKKTPEHKEYYIDDEAMTEQEFNAKKADRNKDGKLSGWEREVGKEVAAAKAKKK